MHNDKKIETLAHNIVKAVTTKDVESIKSAMVRLTANGGQYLDDAVELSSRIASYAMACTDAAATKVLEGVVSAIDALPIGVQHRADRALAAVASAKEAAIHGEVPAETPTAPPVDDKEDKKGKKRAKLGA